MNRFAALALIGLYEKKVHRNLLVLNDITPHVTGPKVLMTGDEHDH